MSTTPRTLTRAQRKARRANSAALIASQARASANLPSKLAVMPRMMKDVALGRWGAGTGARGNLLLAAGALLYLISPIDLLPEAVLLIPGFLDDAALALFATTRVLSTTEQYMADTAGYTETPIPATATRRG